MQLLGRILDPENPNYKLFSKNGLYAFEFGKTTQNPSGLARITHSLLKRCLPVRKGMLNLPRTTSCHLNKKLRTQ